MSSFYLRKGDPRNEDIATHDKYGIIRLIGKIEVSDNWGDTFWIAVTDENELKIVNQSDITNVGYYGD